MKTAGLVAHCIVATTIGLTTAASSEIRREQWPIAAAARILSVWTLSGLSSGGHRGIVIVSDTEARQGPAVVFLQAQDDPCTYQVRFEEHRKVYQLRFDHLFNDYSTRQDRFGTAWIDLHGQRETFCVWTETEDTFFRPTSEITSTPPAGAKGECRTEYSAIYGTPVIRALKFMASRCPPKDLPPY